MDDDHELILIAAYGDLDTARSDFEELTKRAKHGLEMRAAALVTKDADGHPTVVEAHNKHGRVGAGLGAGVGILLGLFVPPFGLAVLVGATAGAVVASVAEHELRTGLRHEVGEALEAGTGVIITVTYPNGRIPVEKTLTKSHEIRSLRMDKSTIASIEQTVADELAKLPHPPEAAVTPGTTDTST